LCFYQCFDADVWTARKTNPQKFSSETGAAWEPEGEPDDPGSPGKTAVKQKQVL